MASGKLNKYSIKTHTTTHFTADSNAGAANVELCFYETMKNKL